MARFLKGRQKKRGAPPGSLIHIGNHIFANVKMNLMSYSRKEVIETSLQRIEDALFEAKDSQRVTWVDIEGLSDTKVIEEIGKEFGIHRLWLEDVLNTDHRPKVDELNDLLFVIIKSISENAQTHHIQFEQVSLFLGENFVLSFQEYPGDMFNVVRERIRQGKGRIRQVGPDYLFYALIDSVVDNYYQVLERLGERIEGLEKLISGSVSEEIPQQIISLKNELLYINKSARPIRDALAHICRTSTEDIKEETKAYFHDAHEHAVQIVDVVETYRQMLNSLLDFYQSRMNQRLNEVMKILTLFATIFIPLTFIVGIYGMNFENMPELHWKHGYAYVWVLMLTVSGSMVYYFKKRGLL